MQRLDKLSELRTLLTDWQDDTTQDHYAIDQALTMLDAVQEQNDNGLSDEGAQELRDNYIESLKRQQERGAASRDQAMQATFRATAQIRSAVLDWILGRIDDDALLNRIDSALH